MTSMIEKLIERARKYPADEHKQQVALFAWASTRPELRWMHAIPNGEIRHIQAAKRLKQEGVKAGVSDVFLPLARHGYYGLYIEMKGVNGRPSKLQKEFLAHCDAEGYDTTVCSSFDEARDRIEQYLEVEDG